MEWIVLTGILVCVLLVIYGRLREELNNNKSKQINALKKQVKEQYENAHNRDKETLGNADVRTTVGFLNRLHSDDKGTD